MEKENKKIMVTKKIYDYIEMLRKETQAEFSDEKITHNDVIDNLLN